MRWLVTGSAGFIGPHFLNLLDGEEVVTLNARTRLGPIPSGVENHVGDITDPVSYTHLTLPTILLV